MKVTVLVPPRCDGVVQIGWIAGGHPRSRTFVVCLPREAGVEER